MVFMYSDFNATVVVRQQNVIQVKTFDEVVNGILARLAVNQTKLTDFNPGSIVRNIIEALAFEIGTNTEEATNLYATLSDVYNSAFVDTANGTSLDYVVSLLGITRIPAGKANGQITFSRTTPAPSTLTIPQGTRVTTQPVLNESVIEFETDYAATILTGGTSVTVTATAVVGGVSGNVAPDTLFRMSNPPFGIQQVTNTLPMSGGSDQESDNDLRSRAKHALETAGRATVNAIKYAVLAVAGVRTCTVLDLNRGIGTADVLCTSTDPANPLLTGDVRDAVIAKIAEYKAAGVDVQLQDPSVVYIDIDTTLTLDIEEGFNPIDIKTNVINAITAYINGLGIGDDVIKNKIIGVIMGVTGVKDVNLSSPTSNITIGPDEIARAGTMDIDLVGYVDRGINLDVEL